jgi:sec-independent protein translocase protein TatA
MNLGFTEVLVILVLVLVLFGSKKIPELGSALGKSIQNFKKGLNQNTEEDKKDKEA